ncbi:hypothetical protein M3Y97_00380700 [Aphelenchoides bicaudatus]|nr:hypothetical protein M3Y97_00380700 [Aphelenchoides bicaudatus]
MKDPELFVEEAYLDGSLHKHQSVFSPDSIHVASITGRHVIVFDVKTGKRKLILPGKSTFCGLKWQDDNTLLTISSKSMVRLWDLKAGESVSQFNLNFEGSFLWTYNVEESVFAVALTKEKEQVVLRLDLDEGSTELCAKLPLNIQQRRAVCPSEQFVLYCNGREIVILPYKDVEMKGDLKFYFPTKYSGLSKDSVKFNSVTMVKNAVFAVLSTGRVVYWQNVAENGLKGNQMSYFHGHYTEPCIAVTSLLTVFCGAANSRVDKWNAVTSGSGRYERYQVMERMDAPVEALWLSPDSNYILANLADNSSRLLLFLDRRPLHWPAFYDPLKWLGLCTDIEHPDYVVANTRTGYIQWIDPFDVSKENPPPRDCINIPIFNWTNVYAASFTSSMIATVEQRRNESEKSLLKFFHRLAPGATYDMKQMGCIKLDYKVKFIRTNFEEVRHDLSEHILHEHYVVVVDHHGNLRTFYPNSYEHYRWTADLRRTFDWQQTKVLDCSSIRSNTMATVNAANNGQGNGIAVLIWDTETGNLGDLIDSIANVSEARWCSPQKFREFILLIASKEMITAYDADAKNFLWVTMEPNMKLYTNLFANITYGNKEAYVINQRDGSVLKHMTFSHDQDQVVATGNASNIRLSGLNAKGLSLLKLDTKENLTLRDIEIFTRSTPFSALIQQARVDSQPASTNQQLHRTKMLSARKLLEGSAYSLAPITKLAPAFVGSCLISRSA